uniref:Carboxylesterase 5A n=1 Tax=Cebus imitator TaxID=2715852 RepID=A0A2K5QYS3_CEBIM
MNGNWVHPGQILIWAIWVPAAASKGPSAEGPQRNTRLGWIQGKQVTVLGSPVPVNVFLGVPFAAPPLGPLCFTNPQPAPPWDNLREATSYPNLGGGAWWADWMFLSPPQVLVWLPGGAFQTGSASIFDGSSLAAYKDVLVVIAQYRLGIFGFFTTWDQYAPGNWAFKDQVAALSWVQKNIEFFGGDPNSVTTFGESAGAISVSGLMLSPMAEGLFHKAIMESGVAISPYLNAQDYETSEDVVVRFYGYNASDSEALLRCLKTKSSKELLTLSQKTKSFTRVVDGAFFPNEPLVLLSQKAFKAIPSIIGVNNHECGFLLPLRAAPEILSGSNKSLALRMIYNILVSSLEDSLLDLLGDVFFVVPGHITARYHRDAGTPVYFYEFQHWPQCFEDMKPAFVKADHADEVHFVFGGAFLKGDIVMFQGATEEEKLLSQKMMKYWANFAGTGNPNGDDLPLWPAYNLTEQYLQLVLNMSLGQRLKERRVQLWTSTIPLILSASDTLHSPLSSLTFLSLLQPFFFSCVP